MAARTGDRSLVTASSADELARQFLKSAYADSAYIDWTLDRRLEGFLHRRGLDCLVEDGDAYDLVLERVMVHIGDAARAGTTEAPGRPAPAN
ncbi:hypothetical protein AO501_11300 [Mycobacterium gordonae]|uniref:Uncharacterized protein n=1 Tax=Mycobacterium gordonae TaxID=1778 RepID=A0A0Q2RNW0_MYCGO|nr:MULTISPECIES: hypothetical protein [Mycobacterium]KQH77043.1 hypothetical protein AO501_11300 [Mycobacterium gordonae]MDP7728335.1 hypothetical protein [Mycobacterium sp. TY813]